VLSSSPENGSTGVSKINPALELKFDNAMNPSETYDALSIKGVYQNVSGSTSTTETRDLKALAATPVWSDGNKRLNVTFSGYFKDREQITMKLSTEAKSEDGHALAQAFTSSFKTAFGTAQIFRVDGQGCVLNDGTTAISPEFTYVGDDNRARESRCFYSFNFSSLPNDLLRISFETQIRLTPSGPLGYPDDFLGKLLVEGVNFGDSIDANDFNTDRTVAAAHQFSNYGGLKVIQVAEQVRYAWEHRASNGNRAQFRVRYENGSSGDNYEDGTYFFGPSPTTPDNAPYLYVYYETL
jgi:Bacterial Ig-like domain